MSSDRPIVYYNYKQKCFPKDINKAIAYLTQSAEQKNEWADYQLGRLFRKIQKKQLPISQNRQNKATSLLNTFWESFIYLGKAYRRTKNLQ